MKPVEVLSCFFSGFNLEAMFLGLTSKAYGLCAELAQSTLPWICCYPRQRKPRLNENRIFPQFNNISELSRIFFQKTCFLKNLSVPFQQCHRIITACLIEFSTPLLYKMWDQVKRCVHRVHACRKFISWLSGGTAPIFPEYPNYKLKRRKSTKI